MTTNINITSSDTNNKTVQKTITGINPEATSAQLVSAAQKVVALTNDNYVKTDRVDTVNCDTEASGKLTPTFTLSSSTLEKKYINAGGGQTGPITITYDGDGSISVGDFSVANPGYSLRYH